MINSIDTKIAVFSLAKWQIFTFTFMHLADAFIQSDLHCIQVTVSTFYQLLFIPQYLSIITSVPLYLSIVVHYKTVCNNNIMGLIHETFVNI